MSLSASPDLINVFPMIRYPMTLMTSSTGVSDQMYIDLNDFSAFGYKGKDRLQEWQAILMELTHESTRLTTCFLSQVFDAICRLISEPT